MKILEIIVVEQLPIQCSHCLLCEMHGKPGSLSGWCWALKTEVIPHHIPRPIACPLILYREELKEMPNKFIKKGDKIFVQFIDSKHDFNATVVMLPSEPSDNWVLERFTSDHKAQLFYLNPLNSNLIGIYSPPYERGE